MSKMLIALQYWHGDQPMAMKLARLIADLEHRHSEDADFLLFARYDTSLDAETKQYVNRKFNVWSATNRRRASGWPFGCNELWFGTMDWVYTMQKAKKIPQYKCVLTIEADGCPMVPHWIKVLSDSWDEAQKEKPTYVYGAMLKYPGTHVNGNAMFSCDPKFLYWLTRKVVAVTPHMGWDYVMANSFQTWGWGNCPYIRSYWRTSTFTEKDFVDCTVQNVAYLHGVKDMSAMDICRQRYSLPPG